MSAEMMQAAVILGPGQAGLAEIPIPEPAAGEVVVRIDGCGVCASNIPLWEGRPWFNYPAPPGSPGHEGWGRVHAVGNGVNNLLKGDRVTLLSYNAYAEFDKVPSSAVVKLPDVLDALPFPGESIGCALNVFKRSEVRAGQAIAVIGAGFLGLIFIALAARKGARVIAISRRPDALELARKYGAFKTVLLDDHQRVIDEVKEIAGEQGCDRVVEATGHQWPLDLAGELVRERGKIIIAGFHQDGPRHVNIQLWNWKGIDVVNAHERDPAMYIEGIKAGIEAVESGILKVSDLVTHVFDLADLESAYKTLVERPAGFIKGMVRIRQ